MVSGEGKTLLERKELHLPDSITLDLLWHSFFFKSHIMILALSEKSRTTKDISSFLKCLRGCLQMLGWRIEAQPLLYRCGSGGWRFSEKL